MIEIPNLSIPDFEEWGITAFTTTRQAGTFSVAGNEPVGEVMSRWSALQNALAENAPRIATVRQVHGNRVIVQTGGWSGWLRGGQADGLIAIEKGTALATTVADCVPVFLAHASGVVGLLHSGWRGTVARITEGAIAILSRNGLAPADIAIHLGPAICGRCYEVSADVRAQLTGETANRPGNVDLRSLIAEHARSAGVRKISVSQYCTRCDNDQLFSHRAADSGRQIGVIYARV
ncbi:MAG: polyphenol oxidase family protein [Gemmatimonadaceae bacterium]|nr:polyphenol oxidase family protein [Gemmatimonadaceae bacterium]